MQVSVGTVTQITGKFIVVRSDGKQEPLKAGDTIHKGDRVIAEDGKNLAVLLENGQSVTLDGTSDLTFDASVVGKELFAKEEVAINPEELSALMEEEIDLEKMEETAAGENANQEYVSGGGFIDRNSYEAQERSAATSSQSDKADRGDEDSSYFDQDGYLSYLSANGQEDENAASDTVSSEPSWVFSSTESSSVTTLDSSAAQNALDSAQTALVTATSASQAAQDAAGVRVQEQKSIDADDQNTLERALQAAQDALDSATSAKGAAESAVAEAQKAVEAAQKLLDEVAQAGQDTTETQAQLDAANQTLDAAKAAEATAQERLEEAKEALATVQTEIDDALAAEAASDAAIAKENSEAADALAQAKESTAVAESAVTLSKEAARMAQEAQTLIDTEDPVTLQNAEDAAREALDAAQQAKDAADQAVRDAQSAVREAQEALDAAAAGNEDTTSERAALEAALDQLESATQIQQEATEALERTQADRDAIEEITINSGADLDSSSDTGSDTADNFTSDNRPTFSGKAEIGSTVEIIIDGGVVATVSTDAEGNWSYQADTLSDGSHTVVTKVTDEAGHVNESDPLTVVIDTSVTAAEIELVTDSGVSGGDQITNDNTPTFAGRTEAGATVVVMIGGTAVGSVTADDEGAWSFTTQPLDDGEYEVSIRVTDSLGNSAQSDAVTVTVDTVTTASMSLSDEGNGNGIIDASEAAAATVSGTVEAGAKITAMRVVDGAGVEHTIDADTITVHPDGSWSVSADMSQWNDGTLTVMMTAQDRAGNETTVTDTIILNRVIDAPKLEVTVDAQAISVVDENSHHHGGGLFGDIINTLFGRSESNENNGRQLGHEWGHRGEGNQGNGHGNGFGNWFKGHHGEDESLYYDYALLVSAELTDSNESLSAVTLNNIPEGMKLYYSNGAEVDAQTDGSYQLEVTSGEDLELVLRSEQEVDSDALSAISASVSSFDVSGNSEITMTEATVNLNIETDISGVGELTLEGSAQIDFSHLAELSSNISSVVMGEGEQSLNALRVQDVLDITSSDNELVIKGDATDMIALDHNSNWTATGESVVESDGHTYDIYQSSFADTTVTLKIDTTIQVDDIG